MALYNFLHSLTRLDTLLDNSPSNKDVLSYIPTSEEVTKDVAINVCATIVCIKINTNKDLLPKEECKYLHAFISEVTQICHSNECCRDIVFMTDYLMVVYSTPQKVNVDAVIDDSARINSLAMVVSKKSNGKFKLSVTIGIDYGQVMMMPIVSPDNKKTFTWYGPTIQEAKKLTEGNNQEYIYITQVIWNNIKTENQRLFKKNSIMEDYYAGSIINIIMNNWVKTAE